jgi:hypothetical protein
MMDAAALLMLSSPTKTCRVRVSSTRYRNDPYRARVNALLSVASPLFVPKNTKKVALPPVALTAAALAIPADAIPVPVAAAESVLSTPTDTTLPAKSFAAADARKQPAKASVAAPAAKAGPSDKPQVHYALIGFKHEATMFQAPFRVAVGDVVIVEADRGEHIGVVQSITTTAPSFNVPSRILRHASAREVELIDELTLKEKRVSSSIQKLSESLGLGIRVNDTEFQMDGNKLTVFFSSKVFVDFRKLQRSLFREHRCRIWLVNWTEVRPYTPVPVNPVC